MVFHMKTTLIIHDSLMDRLRQKAAKTGHTISELVEAALRMYLKERPPAKDLPPLPSWDGGPFLVDITDREAIYQAQKQDDEEEDK